MWRFLCLVTLVFSITALHSQAAAGRSGSGIFPLALLLDAVSAPEIWRPDWPVELPPDAFRVLSGEVSRITLEGEGVLLSRGQEPGGVLREFPFMLNGKMTQVSLYVRNGEIWGITLSFPLDGDTWKLEFLEYPEENRGHDGFWQGFPALVRASIGNAWYFITLSRWARGITETWFDVEGTILGGYYFSLTTIGENQRIRAVRDLLSTDTNPDLEYNYDSWGFVTRVSGPGGTYTVLHYRDALPRYWERGDGAGNFYLQWDANGFLVRMTRTGAGAGDWPVEYRFEYTLDERGNWIERQEIRMFYRYGLLFPLPGTIFTRVLEYAEARN